MGRIEAEASLCSTSDRSSPVMPVGSFPPAKSTPCPHRSERQEGTTPLSSNQYHATSDGTGRLGAFCTAIVGTSVSFRAGVAVSAGAINLVLWP